MGRGIISKTIDKKDVIETFVRSSGPGGQNVNKTSTCVQLLHCPTGIRVKCQESRSQDINRQRAWELLKEKIYQQDLKKQQDMQHEIQRKKRQHRKRSKLSKEKMLADKKYRALIKITRKRVADEKD